MRLSIITVNLNNKHGLEKTILSVVQQTFSEFEFIIIDGGSVDGSRDIIDNYRTQIDYVVSETDGGIYDAMNKGVLKSSGDYLLFLNAGDYLHNSETLANVFALDFSEEFILFDYLRKHSGGKDTICYEDTSFEFLIEGSICHQSVLHKRTVFKALGLFNDQLQIAADYELFLKAFYKHNCSFRFVNQILTIYNDVEGKSKDAKLLKKERRLAQESVLDHRVVNILDKQSNIISDLNVYRDRYEGLMKSRSVIWTLKSSDIARSIIKSANKLLRLKN